MLSALYWVGGAFAFLLIAPIAHWCFQPLLARANIYRFHSAFLFSFQNPDHSIALHLGTTYDVVTKLRLKRRKGERWASTLRRDIGEGLVEFIRWAESSAIPHDRKVTIGSHFLSELKMARLGFRAAPSPASDYVNVVLIYWELVLLQRIFTRKWRRIPVATWKTYNGSVGELIAARELIERMVSPA